MESKLGGEFWGTSGLMDGRADHARASWLPRACHATTSLIARACASRALDESVGGVTLGSSRYGGRASEDL